MTSEFEPTPQFTVSEMQLDEIEDATEMRLESWCDTYINDEAGAIIGSTTPYVDEEGVQHLGSLYVDKKWHGKGVAHQLMQQAINFLDPSKPIVLGATTYNERAKAFYRKWGFVETPGSERLFDGVMPEVEMVRPPQNEMEENYHG